MSQNLHCPFCRSLLSSHRALDPSIRWHQCERGHRFREELGVTVEQGQRSSSIATPAFASDADCIAFWLTHEEARGTLSDVLAEILERILSSRSVSQNRSFAFCPRCAEPLAAVQDDDLYVQGLRCHAGHSWGTRGAHLGTTEMPRVSLYRELTDREVEQNARYLAAPSDPITLSIVPESVREVLVRYLSRPGTERRLTSGCS